MTLVRVYCGLASADLTTPSSGSSTWLTVALVDDAGRLLDICDISDDSTGYADLGALLAARSDGPTAVAVAADSDDHVVTQLLNAAGRYLAYTDDDSADDYAQRFAEHDSPEEMQSSPAERRAVGLARALQAGVLSAVPHPVPRDMLALKPVLAAHAALLSGRRSTASTLREVLRELYPAALRAFPDPAEPVPLAILDALPEPGALAAVGRGHEAEVVAELVRAGAGDAATLGEAIAALGQAITETPRRTAITRSVTSAVSATIRQTISAVRASDAAADALVRVLAERATTAPATPSAVPRQRTAGTAAAPPRTREPHADPRLASRRNGRQKPAGGPIHAPAAGAGLPAPSPAYDPLTAPAAGTGEQPLAPARAGSAPLPRRTPATAEPSVSIGQPAAGPRQPMPGRPVSAQPASAPPLYPMSGPPFPAQPTSAPPLYPMSSPPVPAPPISAPPMATRPTSGPPMPTRPTPAPPLPTRQASGPPAGRSASRPPAADPLATPPFSAPPAAAHAQGPASLPPTGPRGGRGATSGYPTASRESAPPPRPSTDFTAPGSRTNWPLASEPLDDLRPPLAPPAPAEDRYGANDLPRPIALPRPSEGRVKPPWQADDLPSEPPALRLVEPAPLADPALSGGSAYRDEPRPEGRLEPPALRLVDTDRNGRSSRPGRPADAEAVARAHRNGRPADGLLPDAGAGAGDRGRRGLSDADRALDPNTPISTESDGDLLIFAAARSAWFSDQGDDDTELSWSSSTADDGWRAAQRLKRPSVGTSTGAGLPQRVPQENLVPGSPISTQARPLRIVRDAAAIAAHTTGYFRGYRRGQEVGGYPVGGRPGREAAGGWDFTREGSGHAANGSREYEYRSAGRR